MADMFVHTCFAFRCTAPEWSLLQEAFLLSMDLCAGIAPAPRGPEFTTLFAGNDDGPWAGFLDLFDDHRFPDFGADLAGGSRETGEPWRAIISAEVSLDPMAIARLIQRCCPATFAENPIGFEWSNSCSRQRPGEFGGGWCAVFPDRIEIETTFEALSKALAGDID